MKGTIIFDLEGTLVDVGGESLSRVFIDEKMLEQVANQYKLGIVTGATRIQLEYVLHSTFLNKFFNSKNTVTKDECAEVKATGEPFQILLDKGFPAPVVVIGDSEGDKLGAEALGVSFVEVHTSQLMVGKDFSQYLQKAIESLSSP